MSANPFDQQKAIPGVKNIIAVGSGKGGVGKSTVSTNLAVALAKSGLKTGLLDADIYGPSLPRMMGVMNQKPEVSAKNMITPLERYGVKVMSMGLLVEEDMAVVWRGPMLFKAMNQFFFEVDWGELDVLLIDLPPGTGDVQLSMAQKVPLTGALTVTTPQNIALADMKKSMDMFDRVGVPIFGVVENMSYMVHPDNPEEKISIFPTGELDAFIDSKGIDKLAQIPLQPQIAKASEAGIPLVAQGTESVEAQSFTELANSLQKKLNI